MYEMEGKRTAQVYFKYSIYNHYLLKQVNLRESNIIKWSPLWWSINGHKDILNEHQYTT